MAGLDGTVQVPVAGKLPKKELAIGGVVLGVLIVVYYVRKPKSTPAATAAGTASTTDQYPPDGTTGDPSDPYSTDPATNQTYGNESAGAGAFGAFGTGAGYSGSAAAGTYPWDGSYGNPSDPYSMDTATGTTYGNEGQAGSGTGTSGGPPFSNNTAWSNWVIQQTQTLNPSADIGALIDALGLYLDGQPVSPAQKTLVLNAEAIGGAPPVAGPNNYPPNVRLNGSKGPNPAPRGAPVSVPDVKGKQAQDAVNAVEAAGFKAHVTPARKPGVEYTATGQSPAAGRKAARGSTVTIDVQEVRKLATKK